MLGQMDFPHRIEYKDFSIDGRQVVLDVASCEFMDVRPVVLDILKLGSYLDRERLFKKLLRRYTRIEIDSGVRTLLDYRRKGVFLDKDKIHPFIPPSTRQVNLRLNIANDCNLRCRYCFADYMNSRGYMTKEVARKGVDFLLNYMGRARSATIMFYGGEPLLNPGVIKEVIGYAGLKFKRANKRIKFQLSTNGTLLTRDMVDLFSRVNSTIYLSIDGPPRFNDLHRPFKNGKGSYKKATSCIPYLLKSMPSRVELCSVTTGFSPTLLETYNYLSRLGFPVIKIDQSLYSPDPRFGIQRLDLQRYEREYRSLVKGYGEDLRRGKMIILRPLDMVLRLRPGGCGIGRECVAIVPNGDVYACPNAEGMEELKLGDVRGGIDSIRHRYFLEYTCETHKVCKACWARYLCGGGCEYVNLKINGDRETPPEFYCRHIKLRIESSLRLLVSLPEAVQKGFIKGYRRSMERG